MSLLLPGINSQYNPREEARNQSNSGGGAASREEMDSLSVSQVEMYSVPEDITVRLPLSRQFGPVKIKDWIEFDEESLIALSNALNQAAALNELGYYSPFNRMMKGNNAVLRNLGADKKRAFERFRALDLDGWNWSGPLRVLGIVKATVRPKLVGYVVRLKRDGVMRLPDLERSFAFPTGSASNTLGKTYQDLRTLVEFRPVYSTYELSFDTSVSTIYEEEGKYLRNTVTQSDYGFLALDLISAGVDRGGSFLSNAVEAMDLCYLDGVTEHAVLSSPLSVSQEDAAKLHPYLRFAEGQRGVGVPYQFLSSKAYPDPIMVGNEGDARGNMVGAPNNDATIVSSSGFAELAVTGAGWMHLLPMHDPEPGVIGEPNKGWGIRPVADGGMTWNVSHMQASNWLDGQTLNADGSRWYMDGYFCAWMPDKFLELVNTYAKIGGGIQRASVHTSAPAGSMVLPSFNGMPGDGCFIPIRSYKEGYSSLIVQGGSAINLAIDQYAVEEDHG